MASRKVLKSVVAGAAGLCTFGLSAVVITDTTGYITFTATDAGGTSSMIAGGVKHWSDGQDPHAGGNYLVQGNGNANWFNASTFLIRTIEGGNAGTFAGDSLTLDDGCVNLKMVSGSTETANWILYGCRIANGNAVSTGEVNQRVDGPMLVKGTAANPSCFACSASGGDRAITVASNITGDSDAMIKVCRTPTDGADTAGKTARVCFRGDNSNYKGRWKIVGSTKNRYYLDFIGTKAIGTHDPSDGLPLIETSDQSWLRCIPVAFTNQNYISATGNLNITATDGGNLSGRRPSEGAYFAKGFGIKGDGTGDLQFVAQVAICLDDVTITGFRQINCEGTMRFYPGYDNRDLPIVTTGNSCNICDEADGLGPVTLKDKGYLQPGFDIGGIGYLGMQSLTVEDGSYYICSLNATTNDFVRIYGNFVRTGTQPFPIRFDGLGDPGKKYKILSAANLGTDITLEDFTFEGYDTYVNTLFEGTPAIETIDGEKVLTFTPSNRHVVKLTGQDGNAPTSFDAAGFWDNASAPSADYDYVIPSGKLLRCRTNNGTFRGHSLNVAGGGDMAINGVNVTFDILRLFDNSIVTIRSDGTGNILNGNVYVLAAKGSPANIELETGGTRELRMPATLHGNGDLRFRYYHTSTPGSKWTLVYVTGDNSDFTGGVELHQNRVTVDFANEAAIGGPGTAFRADRITFSSNATFRCSNSFALQDPTFGITIKPMGAVGYDGGRFEVLEGKTLDVSIPIAGSSSLRKCGPGTLVFSGNNVNTYSGYFRHQEGNVVFRNPNAIANVSAIQYYVSTTYRLELGDEPLNLKGNVVFEQQSAGCTLNLSTSALDARPTNSMKVPLFRIGGAADQAETFDTSFIVLDWGAAAKGYATEIVAEAEGNDLIIYASVKTIATLILFR